MLHLCYNECSQYTHILCSTDFIISMLNANSHAHHGGMAFVLKAFLAYIRNLDNHAMRTMFVLTVINTITLCSHDNRSFAL